MATLGVGRHSEGVDQINLMEKVTLEPRREPRSQANHVESVTAQETAGRLTMSVAGIVSSNEICWEERSGELLMEGAVKDRLSRGKGGHLLPAGAKTPSTGKACEVPVNTVQTHEAGTASKPLGTAECLSCCCQVLSCVSSPESENTRVWHNAF